MFLTNRDDITSCTVVKSCLNTDHLALTVNCVTSRSILCDRDRTTRWQIQFYDIRKCFIDKLGQAIYEFDWSGVTDRLNVTEAYSAFLHNLHCLVEQSIAYQAIRPHITPLVKSLLRRRNKLCRKGKTDDANQLSTKIGKLIADFRATQLQRLSHCDTRCLWATVKPSLGKSNKPVSLAEMYGDGFANLDKINQFFADIATDPNYDADELCHLRSVAEENDMYSGAITNEYEVHILLMLYLHIFCKENLSRHRQHSFLGVQALCRRADTCCHVPYEHHRQYGYSPTYVAQGACHTCT